MMRLIHSFSKKQYTLCSVLVVAHWYLFLQIFYKFHSNIRTVISSEYIRNEFSVDLHLYLKRKLNLRGLHECSDEPTISSAPRMTPQRTLLNHRPPSNASSGSSTNSARGFSSRVSVNEEPIALANPGGPLFGRLGEAGGKALCVTVGVMLRKDLNPTYASERSGRVIA